MKVCHLIVQILNLLGSGILGGEEGTILGAGGFNSQFLCAGNIGINFTALFVHNQQGFHIAGFHGGAQIAHLHETDINMVAHDGSNGVSTAVVGNLGGTFQAEPLEQLDGDHLLTGTDESPSQFSGIHCF